ncbi:MAG: hypothetical protein JWM02_1531 [Frankiales bacterium]|nr:hypothetical protein [Frankiales bacterium]
MPEIAAAATEAVLLKWPVAENSPFSAGDVIATVETEKALVDVEADADGIMLKILVSEGAAVEVGAPIALLGDPGEKVDDLKALLAELGLPARESGVTAAPDRDAPHSHGGSAAPSEASLEVVAAPARNGHEPLAGSSPSTRIFASPLARRLAKDAKLPVEHIQGTGPGGRIIRRDVEEATAKRTALTAALQPTAVVEPSARPQAAPNAAAAPASVAARALAYVDTPHSRMRQAIAARLTESKQSIPHFYLRGTCRVGRLLSLRAELNASSPTRVSVNDLVIKAAARAHLLVPAINVIWTPEAIRSFSTVDVSVAIATERGLVTPVLRSVEQMSVSAVAAQVQDLAGRAKSGTLRQDEIVGGALSITNLGMFGTEEFSAILNPPQAAILAVGAARKEPVVKGGKVKVGHVMRVTLSVDHRPVDGAVAAEWMRTFISLVEDPLQILA